MEIKNHGTRFKWFATRKRKNKNTTNRKILQTISHEISEAVSDAYQKPQIYIFFLSIVVDDGPPS